MTFYAGDTPGKTSESPTYLAYIPHGVDTKKFYPLPENDEQLIEVRKKLVGDNDVTYIIFFNSRNIRRKMTPDILLAFNKFMKQLSVEEQQKCRLVLHTQPIDEHGTDLPVLIDDVIPDMEPYIIFSKERIEAKYINLLYNVADVTINLSSNEGFGLGTCESMMAGTPIIVNVTGGLQDQCGFTNDSGEYLDPERDFGYNWGSNHDGRFKNHGEWVFPVWPVSLSLQGSPLTPYIFDDRCSWEEASNRMMEVYRMTRKERKQRGEAGRQYGLTTGMFTADKMCDSFIEHIETVWATWTPRERFTLVKA